MSAAETQHDQIPNGSGAAAILAAGIGAAALGVLAFANDASETIGKLMVFYKPTGGLSGVTTLAILIWLLSWIVLGKRWRGRNVGMGLIGFASFTGLAVGFLLTFPPVIDLLQGK